jgi:transcriptional regulator
VKLSIEWRRSKVLELQSQGYSQAEISRTLRVSEPTISRDIAALRTLANEEIKNHIANLPEEYSKAIAGLNLIIRKAFTLSEQAPSIRDRNASLVVAKDTIALKFDLQTDSEVINTA